jgi:hypothetical protein
MKIAMLYAAWDGEGWSTPIGIHNELLSRGHEIRQYNLYHDDGALLPGRNIRTYSAQCLNKLKNDIEQNIFTPDVVFQMDYGVFDAGQLDKRYFPNTVWVMEAGDEPQSHRMNFSKAHKFHAVLSPDYPSYERYIQSGLIADWWTHHADTRIFHPRDDVSEVFDCVTTCGPRGNGLTKKVEKALKGRFNNERYFFGMEHGKRLCMGKMVFQCSQHGEVTRRVFEGMACGKMVIADRLPEQTRMHELFVDGEDIVYYDNADDAIDKINYYSNNDEERLRIAKNGMEKVWQEHSQIQRVDALERIIEECRMLV